MDSERATTEGTDWACSLYVQPSTVAAQLRTLVASLQLPHPWTLTETGHGLLVSFTAAADAEAFCRADVQAVCSCVVRMARLGPQHLPHTQAVLLRDVPSMIPVEDIRQAFQELSIPVGAVDRSPQHVRVEVLRRSDYELLLVRGLSFFGVTSFAATPDPGQHGRAGDGPGSRDAVVQCYRCQGFWHTAASCRHQPRCVRCGEAHGVELCVHPRDDPTCCNCRGRHHASYAHCPVRVRLSSAVPVCLALSGGRHGEPA